jgi:hypothetical protein
MSRVWEAIKQVERQRALPGQPSSPAQAKSDERPVAAYVEGVRRRWHERVTFTETQPSSAQSGKPLKL